MRLDKRALERFLSMNDEQLSQTIRKLAKDSGLDPEKIQIREGDLDRLRTALSGADNRSMLKLAEQMKQMQGGKEEDRG